MAIAQTQNALLVNTVANRIEMKKGWASEDFDRCGVPLGWEVAIVIQRQA